MTFFGIFLLTISVFAGSAFAENSNNPVTAVRKVSSRAAALKTYDETRRLYLWELEQLLAKGKLPEAGVICTQLGEINQLHGMFPAAETDYKKALDLLKRSVPANDLRMVKAMDDLGWMYITWGKYTDGARLMDQARARGDRARANDPGLIGHLDTLAAYLEVTGKYSEAAKQWTRAMKIGEMTFGAESPQYDNILVHLGQASALNGEYDIAAQMFRRYLDIEDRVSSTPTTSHAVAAGELAHVYVQLHKFPEARSWFDKAFLVFDSNPNEAPLVRSMVISYLGDFYMAQDDWMNAEMQYRQALEIQQKVLGNNHAVAASMITLSNALKKLHLKDQAKDLAARAKAIIAAEKNPLEQQTVDVTALRRQ